MKNTKRTGWRRILPAIFLLFAFQSNIADESLTILIDVSPSVLNLQNQGQVVTVHTNISYYLVSASSVTLNGIEINSWKSDDRGNFVAKFLIEAVKDLPLNINDYNTLILNGVTIDGTFFTGSEDIRVINVIPKGSK